MTSRTRALLIVVLTCPSGAALADSVSDVLLPLLHLQEIDTRDAESLDPWGPPAGAGMSVRLHDRDLLRRYVGGLKVADFGSRQGEATVRLPLSGTGHWLQVHSSSGSERRDTQQRDLDWAGGLSTRSSHQRVTWDRATATHRWIASMDVQRSRGKDHTTLHHYPSSTSDTRMNRYFWDLLEPTIGQRVDYSWDSRSVGFYAGWVAGGTDGLRWGLQASGRRSDPDTELRYTNTGANPRLEGERHARLDQQLDNIRLAGGVEGQLSRRWRMRAEVGYAVRRYDMHMAQQNLPTSDSGLLLDIVELGQAAATQRGPQVILRAHRMPTRLLPDVSGYVAVSHARTQANAEGETPVLGFRLRALPISHSGQGRHDGRLTSLAAGFQLRQRSTHVGFDLGGMAAQAHYRGRTQASAQMQFGLYASPVDERSTLRPWLGRLSVAPWVRLGHWVDIQYRITQYAGGMRTGQVDTVSSPDSPSSTYRGGRVHTVTAHYRL